MEAIAEHRREATHDARTLPLAAGVLAQPGTGRGIVTGGTATHWPCVGAIAIGAAENSVGLAVADHGFADWQREELERVGTLWIDHERPEVVLPVRFNRPNDPRTAERFWKPFVCAASPFTRSLWIDADAVVTGDVRPLFALVDHTACLGVWRQSTPERLYRAIVEAVLGEDGLLILPHVAHLSSGLVGFHRDDNIIDRWRAWCRRLIENQELLAKLSLFDQSGLMLAAIEAVLGHTITELPLLLAERWHWPADGLPPARCRERRPVPLDPAALLAETRSRCPEAGVVHWGSRPKPWDMAAA